MADRTTRRFALTGLGVGRTPEDTQTGRHQKHSSGSYASPCPYRGCPGRHLGGLSASGRHDWAYICSFNFLLSVSVTAYCHCSGAVQRLILVSRLIRLHVAPGTHSWCATCIRYLAAVFGSGPLWSSHVPTSDAMPFDRPFNWWTQNGDYSMIPATRCSPSRPLLTIHRSDRLPDRPACHGRDRWHRGIG
jgi:hypothetical protein